jgi:hypothetical protein
MCDLRGYVAREALGRADHVKKIEQQVSENLRRRLWVAALSGRTRKREA